MDVRRSFLRLYFSTRKHENDHQTRNDKTGRRGEKKMGSKDVAEKIFLLAKNLVFHFTHPRSNKNQTKNEYSQSKLFFFFFLHIFHLA